MKRHWVTAGLIAGISAMPQAATETRVWDFKALLDGREIGSHRFTRVARGDDHEIRSEANLRVRILFVDAYRYKHEATEQWRGDCLYELTSSTSTNSESEAVQATRRGDRLSVERGAQHDQRNKREEHVGCIMSFAYWNPKVLKARRLLNSQTGELVPVTVTPQGQESIEVRGQPVLTQRYRLSGENLTIDLWYAGEEWVGLESLVKGGRRLRYQLM